LIDSSVLIAAERGTLDLDSVLEEYGHVDFSLAAITTSELLHGVHRADSEERRSRREAFVETLVSRLPVIAFDLIAARTHARLWARLAAKGEAIGTMARGLDVVTRDERSFPRIEGLSLIRW
jgi:predicted nucleic acid-binding protein